mmetsp:Transcript_30990/g.86822  ORF Transcript_30990/g.86822 Transcript_30990/m.86822 type:complete len:143 (+) Transcript_30990:81-509(+)|eukprot:CAMPEP_0119120662 /NCGR_PEP_ID=MMETSP1310-20130426/1610_1 /TAXON_ID=464262 /ORGANISM="Genus nov. species nov., Strain RCC2339" /LENGTH=142 /DNA_ID=CAMNT_0007110153 /DNA_START=81 /DNA_END=509 /DNA_ORIENTATION=+
MASYPKEFEGTWAMDKAQSEDADAMLSAQGVGWMKRKVIAASSVTVTISGDGNKVIIKTETTFSTKVNEWTLGEEVDQENPVLGNVKAVLTVEGNKIINVMKNENGVTTVVRSVEGDKLISEGKFEPTKGETVTLKRIYVKQ